MRPAPALLIDIGNSRLKWAWCLPSDMPRAAGGDDEGRPWITSGALGHHELDRLADMLLAGAQSDMQSGLVRSAGAPAVWVSNVAGPSIAAALDRVLARVYPALPSVRWARSASSEGRLENGYREPARLGVDRWLASIGARAWRPRGNLLIVTAGTATTIDVVTELPASGPQPPRSRFDGGLILPGLALMMGALARNTAQLPALDMAELTHAAGVSWADNTHGAIAAGCLSAQAGAIERVWRALTARGPVHCLLSGGASEALAAAMPVPCSRHENLVLLGLAVLAGVYPDRGVGAAADQAV